MNSALEYPFDSEYILSHKKKIKKKLLQELASQTILSKKIAVLGGSTTHDICLILELFLLKEGIQAEFYESEYNQYYQEAMFPNSSLEQFAPDIIYIHSSNRNIEQYPDVGMTADEIDALLTEETNKYTAMWEHLAEKYRCPIIQNNFEYPYYRLLGNRDASDIHGATNYITRLNQNFYRYAQNHEQFYINDINYVSACYGLNQWADPLCWHMYKYACAVPAIPYLAFNLSKIIKAIFGKNKKGIVLDLDNTLWGGVIGDDGTDNIEIGQETSLGQAYAEFQNYLKQLKQLGVILNIDSKNNYDTAISGLHHPSSILKLDDFIEIRANWEPKSQNFLEIADALNLFPESLVFVDDNPAERALVTEQIPGVSAPELDRIENYVRIMDRSGFFENVSLSSDDLKRSEMYQENARRRQLQSSYNTYADYLKSLEMKAEIRAFENVYMARIAQLTNKTNQFNLTTKRYSQPEVEEMAANPDYITLYGKLEDKFGDNGVVSVVIGKQRGGELDIILWLMSCRVLKRDMEYAMMDALAEHAQERGVTQLNGYYDPTAKNGMVKDFYAQLGFEKTHEEENGSTIWKLYLDNNYTKQNNVIQVNAFANGDPK